MKKSILKFIIILFIFLFLLTGCVSNNTNNTTNTTNANTDVTKTSVDVNTQTAENRINNLFANQAGNNVTNPATTEIEISNYSTVIKDNSAGRLTNIRITCNTLNGTIINPGDTFSFNEIVGEPTAEKGYQEATVIIDHKSEKGIGGGNCQVSSTLYNAVLAIPSLVVTERHEHGKNVTYVPKGKDAAVSYGSLDLKFKNGTNNKIRIDITTDDKNIVAKLIQISE